MEQGLWYIGVFIVTNELHHFINTTKASREYEAFLHFEKDSNATHAEASPVQLYPLPARVAVYAVRQRMGAVCPTGA